MELRNLMLDELPNVRDEPILDALRRAAQAEDAWQPFVQRLIEAATVLESCKPTVRLDTLLLFNPPRLAIHGPNRATVDLWADYYDRRDIAVPSELHYRLQIRRDGNALTRDVRTDDLAEVARQIRLAFSLRET